MDGDLLPEVTLDDKYSLTSGWVFISGTQALVRLPLMQKQRDRAKGLNTGGFISGYRGSPLGGYDAALWQASKHLAAHDIVFRPGLNEDSAATAVWGTQQLNFLPGAKFDGVFSIWYGKGPGVDRSGDPLKHANYQGTHAQGGVLVVCGDDHPGKSSSVAHQSEPALAAHGIPILYPATVQEYLDLGIYGFALSRFAGTLVGFKCVNETLTTTATVLVDQNRAPVVEPDNVPDPVGSVHARPEYDPPGQDARLVRYKLPRAQAFVRANGLDRPVFGSECPTKLGIVTAGKAYLDTMAALRLLGIDETAAERLGIGVYKVAMVWPLEPTGLAAFAEKCDELLFVEEKKPILEDQGKIGLYGRPGAPRIVGKQDTDGSVLLPADVNIDGTSVAVALARRLEALNILAGDHAARAESLVASSQKSLPAIAGEIARTPYFCSGCPHNTSTKLPDGSAAFGGIGCHGMAILMNRNTLPVTHMGGEGVTWTGIAPFTKTPHVFQNLGDGTYTHSGSLGIRAAVQSGANITFKILRNDAVAMTGGQPLENGFTAGRMARQVLDEGVHRVAIVSDAPETITGIADVPNGVTIHHRDELDAVQRTMRDIPGATAIIYEQTCAAEKRRRRKRQRYPDPPKRVLINSLVCEGCGDCSDQANCVSIHPVETTLGRKRKIDQSSCNKDYSCVKGFCPSFVTVHGGHLRPPDAKQLPDGIFADLPEPLAASLDDDWSALVTGVGGSGVVTVGAVLGMAAHLMGNGASIFDMTGLSQKNGAVYSHLRISKNPGAVLNAEVDVAGADLVLGCDTLAATAPVALRAMGHDHTHVVLNLNVTPPPSFQERRDLNVDGRLLAKGISEHVGRDRTHDLDATEVALALTGNTIATNIIMVGYALQKGLLPVSLSALERAIELNGVAVPFNLRALRIGRLLVARPEAVVALMSGQDTSEGSDALSTMVEERVRFLTGYQDAAYANIYREVVEAAQRAEDNIGMTDQGFAEAVARYAFKVMAYKDEYEVARLFTDDSFARQLQETFAGPYKLRFYLAPPLLSRPDPITGKAAKREFGPWMMSVFKVLARLKGLRGTPFDVFGRTAERKAERALCDQYLEDVRALSATLSPDNYESARALAKLPEEIRGFGHVKAAAISAAAEARVTLVNQASRSAIDPAHHVAAE